MSVLRKRSKWECCNYDLWARVRGLPERTATGPRHSSSCISPLMIMWLYLRSTLRGSKTLQLRHPYPGLSVLLRCANCEDPGLGFGVWTWNTVNPRTNVRKLDQPSGLQGQPFKPEARSLKLSWKLGIAAPQLVLTCACVPCLIVVGTCHLKSEVCPLLGNRTFLTNEFHHKCPVC
jgi:hypothetical protein